MSKPGMIGYGKKSMIFISSPSGAGCSTSSSWEHGVQAALASRRTWHCRPPFPSSSRRTQDATAVWRQFSSPTRPGKCSYSRVNFSLVARASATILRSCRAGTVYERNGTPLDGCQCGILARISGPSIRFTVGANCCAI